MPITRASQNTPSGTDFPGSPTTNDRFYRTDRGIEYYYDSAQWLSTEIFTAHLANNAATGDLTATDTAIQRTINPWSGLYAIYGLDAVWAAAVSTTGGWTLNMTKIFGGSSEDLATQAITYPGSNAWTAYRVAINAVIASTATIFYAGGTETSGAATLSLRAALTYRLIG